MSVMKRSYKSWKEHVKLEEIKCQWCEEEIADVKAHIIGKETFRIVSREKGLNDYGEITPESSCYEQMDVNITIGITCKKCDEDIGRKYEADKRYFAAITLWKAIAHFEFKYHKKSNGYGMETIRFDNDNRIPTIEECKLAKERCRDFLENKGKNLIVSTSFKSYRKKLVRKLKKKGLELKPEAEIIIRDPHIMGRGFIGSNEVENAFFQFSIFGSIFAVSASKQEKISKYHVVGHELMFSIADPVTKLTIKPAKGGKR